MSPVRGSKSKLVREADAMGFFDKLKKINIFSGFGSELRSEEHTSELQSH